MTDKYFGSHEIQHRVEKVQGGTDRGFGIVFAVVFGVVGALSWYQAGTFWPWWLGGAGVFGAAALLAPKVLGPLNRIWTKFGLLLFVVISPVVLAILFFLCVMPIGLLLRLFGKDVLNLRRRPAMKSYWIDRAPPGPKPDTLSNQF